MKRIITVIIVIYMLIVSVSALAEDLYMGATPYDLTGNCPSQVLDFCTQGGEAIYKWLGVRTIVFFTPSCKGLAAESYADIVINIMENVLGKTDDVMLVLADAESNELFVWCGEDYAQYCTDEDIAKCTEAQTVENQKEIYNKVSTFYMALAKTLEAKESEIEQMRAKARVESPLDAELLEQPMYVREAKLYVQSEEYKSLYPDLLQAIFVNNSDQDIKNVNIVFVAWDSNNLPVLIKGQYDFNAPSYTKQADYNGVNMVPGSTFGETSGLKLDASVKGISTVKAIVVSYETFDGDTWTNPLYDQFIDQYAGQKLQ